MVGHRSTQNPGPSVDAEAHRWDGADWQGPFNVAAPEPASNRDFSRAQAAGLLVVGHAILGLPGDGREGARRTAKGDRVGRVCNL